MAATLNLAIWGGIAGLSTVVLVSLFTAPKSDGELRGLVYHPGAGAVVQTEERWFATPAFLAALVAACYIALNVIFR
jgi:hypothetical protein